MRSETRRGGESPTDNASVGSKTLAGDGWSEIGTRLAQSGDIAVDGIRRDRPGRQAAARLESVDCRAPDPRGPRQIRIEDADQFQV